MSTSQPHRSVHLLFAVVALCLVVGALAPALQAQTFPQYDHVFLIIMETEGYDGIIGNQYAPILNAIAKDYGLATNYSGVGGPSEPNYVAMLGAIPSASAAMPPTGSPAKRLPLPTSCRSSQGPARPGAAISRTCPTPGYRGYCYRTSATVFPMPTRRTSPSTTAL
jgi:hypothetical protein